MRTEQFLSFSDKAFSFDLYNGDDLVGTFTKTDLGFMQKIQLIFQSTKKSSE
jgi:hypothetical protein